MPTIEEKLPISIDFEAAREHAVAENPHFFTVTGVGTRTGKGPRAAGVPEKLMTSDLETLIENPCDVVVELIGGTRCAGALISWALRLGRHVVSANKALFAADGEALCELARENGVSVQYSAAVGGALAGSRSDCPSNQHWSIEGFSGVLNGTCNFVLDRGATGPNLSSAVRAAQELGYTEASPQKGYL